ncbi:hypothetical protein PCK1_002941 [Pneumocystis canis]|nr:hypothetical protein PCK1_002941 [Pneumocystis canis]
MHVTRYPVQSFRKEIADEDWKKAVHSWMNCMQYCLFISESELESLLNVSSTDSLNEFIKDYLNAHTPRKYENIGHCIEDPVENRLLEYVFLLLYRMLTSERLCLWVLGIPFALFDFCVLYAFDRIEKVLNALEKVHQCAEKEVFVQTCWIRDEFQRFMDQLVSLNDEDLLRDKLMYQITFQTLTVFIRLCLSATCAFLEKENFLQSIICLYHRGTVMESIKPELLSLVFTLFTSFLSENRACSFIVKRFTGLYEQGLSEKELMRDLVLDTSIVECFYEVELFSEAIVIQLRNLKQNGCPKYMENAFNSDLDASVRRLSLVSHMKDMFPEYGEGFIDACLSEYDDNVETVVSHILENSLPSHLSMMDKKASRWLKKRHMIIY